MFEHETIVETKTCRHCQASFDITDQDLEFYEKISPVFPLSQPFPKGEKGVKDVGDGNIKYLIPSPTLCPDCRQQRRLSFRNERKLYKRKCDATGKDIISIYSPDKPYKIYHPDFWWSDAWEATDYGKEYDFSKSFFHQFDDLFQRVPTVSLNAPMSENSEYTNQCRQNKNCYMMFCSGNNEDSYFGTWNQNCHSCVDCLYAELSENCYQTVNIRNCHDCFFSANLENCQNVYLSESLIACTNCIGCINLQHKEYCIFNQQYSKEDYKTFFRSMVSGGTKAFNTLQDQVQKLFEKHPRKYYHGKGNQAFSGDYIESSTRALVAFNVRDNDGTKFCRDSWKIVESYDLVETLQMEYCLEMEGAGFVNHCLFTLKSSSLSDVLYSSHCNFSDHLFGCVGLRNKSYCILNKQYSKEEYETLVPRIIQQMQKNGEWGEFFPSSLSPYGYNETVAMEYFPIHPPIFPDETQFNWSSYIAPFPKVEKIIPAHLLPDDISQIPDDILNWAIECEVTKKPFRIIAQELSFYRKHSLPIPRRHPDQRHLDRMALRNPRKLFARHCDKCAKSIQTTYAPDRPEIVYCEECYTKEVFS